MKRHLFAVGAGLLIGIAWVLIDSPLVSESGGAASATGREKKLNEQALAALPIPVIGDATDLEREIADTQRHWRGEGTYFNKREATRIADAAQLAASIARSEPPAPQPQREQKREAQEPLSPQPDAARFRKVEPAARVDDSRSLDEYGYAGTWTGTFSCEEGVSGMTLTLELTSRPNHFRGRWDFYPIASNPGASTGSLHVNANGGRRGLSVNISKWIDRPHRKYYARSFDVGLGSANQLSGEQRHPKCGSVRLERTK